MITNEKDAKKESLVVDEVGSVDGDEQDFQEQVDASIENTNDNEESINLTIGEEEQKLLHEDEDQDDKEKIKETLENDKADKLNEEEAEKEVKEQSEESNKETVTDIKDEQIIEKNAEKKN